MPAVNVARTDTFETQRQKINQIGEQIFNISAGGSDLATGILKLGDGTKTGPSLAFTSDDSLGLFKPSVQTISFVSSGKNILDLNQETVLSYKDFTVQKKSLFTTGAGIQITPGSGYEFGTFTDVVLKGGSGSNSEAEIFVDYFSGTSGTGDGYDAGTHTAVMNGGTGSGVEITFSVEGILGSVTGVGSGYVEAAYSDVPLTGGNGTGATANIEVDAAGEVINASITSNGDNNYRSGDVLGANNADLGGSGAGFAFTVDNNGGIVNFLNVTKADGYTAGDVLTLPTSQTISGIDIPGSYYDGAASLTSGSTTITLSTATNAIVPGMDVSLVQGGAGIGEFPTPSTVTVLSITNSTTIEVDVAASVTGNAEINFNSPVGNQLTIPGGTANLRDGFIITGVNTNVADTFTITVIDANTVEMSSFPNSFYQAELTFAPSWGDGGADQYEYTINATGIVQSLTITNPGVGYDVGDVLTVDASDLVNPFNYTIAARPTQLITFTSNPSVGSIVVGDLLKRDGDDDLTAREVVAVYTSGGSITSVLLVESGFAAADDLVEAGTASPVFTIDTITDKNKYFIDLNDGNGQQLHPNLTLYGGETYIFDTSSAAGHPLKFSTFRDGRHNAVGPFTTNLLASSDLVSVTSTAGISAGMRIEETGNDVGELAVGTTVEEVVDGSTIRLSALPTASGPIEIQFVGSEYTEGVESSGTTVKIRISDSTPATLYYYCDIHPDMAGEDNSEAVITVDQNNPRVFGSGFQALLTDINTTDIIQLDVVSGEISAQTFTGNTLSVTTAGVSGTLTAPTIVGGTISLDSVTSTTDIEITAGTTIALNGTVTVGSEFSVDRTSGDVLTTGTIKSTTAFNSNEALQLVDATIESINNYDITLEPDLNRIAKVNTNTAFVIPVGNNSERPNEPIAQDGAIRFNTQTNQYEGYSETSSSWSSLGGVRDLDGNTYILAEESIGSNDNTLWFINDNVNTFKFTPEYQEFVNVKKVRSPNVSAPDYNEWTANTPVAVGDYLKYRNNIYEVTTAGSPGDPGGVTATSGNEPTHTSGTTTNGTVDLTYFTTAVANLTFEEINELRIDPLGFTDLVVNNELRFSGNTISSTIQDILIKPSGQQKVEIVAASSLVIPVGDNNSKGDPKRGSIRYNTDDLTFEGFDGAAWGSLGGVKDIDQDTYIIPETSPNADEDTLYFYNANNNTLRITTAGVDFYAIDTITSVSSDTLNVNAATITFDSLATTLDNTSLTSSFLFTTKENFDLGLSSGLTTDPLLRLTDTGDIFYNLGFGTGLYNPVKLFDSELKELELADYRIVTKKVALERGSLNTGDAVLYDPLVEKSAKVTLTAHNTTTGDKEMMEFSVVDNGTDIFFSEIGNVTTGEDLVSTTFDFNASNQVRVTYTLNTALTTGDDVEVTVVSHITKR